MIRQFDNRGQTVVIYRAKEGELQIVGNCLVICVRDCHVRFDNGVQGWHEEYSLQRELPRD